jgi:hypothetical protein
MKPDAALLLHPVFIRVMLNNYYVILRPPKAAEESRDGLQHVNV